MIANKSFGLWRGTKNVIITKPGQTAGSRMAKVIINLHENFYPVGMVIAG